MVLAVSCSVETALEPRGPDGPEGVERFQLAGSYPELYSVNDSLLCPGGGACGTSLPAGTYPDSSRVPARLCEFRIGPSIAVLRADQTFRLDMELTEVCDGDIAEVDALIAGTYLVFGRAADSLDFDGSTVQGRPQAIIGGDVSGESRRTGESAVPEFLHLRIGNTAAGILYRITLRM